LTVFAELLKALDKREAGGGCGLIFFLNAQRGNSSFTADEWTEASSKHDIHNLERKLEGLLDASSFPASSLSDVTRFQRERVKVLGTPSIRVVPLQITAFCGIHA